MKKLVVAAIALTALAVAQTQTANLQPSVELPPELQRVLTDYEKAWGAKNAKQLASLFTQDGFVMMNGSQPVRGRAGIEAGYKNAGGPLSLRAIAYATEGNLGFILGGFSSGKDQPDSGKFTLTLKKQDGKWMIFSDMDNLNSRR